MTKLDAAYHQDALDQLYSAVERLYAHQCGLEYIQQQVVEAYNAQAERAPKTSATGRERGA